MSGLSPKSLFIVTFFNRATRKLFQNAKSIRFAILSLIEAISSRPVVSILSLFSRNR